MAELKIPKKLIEVALPLDDINAAAAREKSIRHGHPSTLHLWWARRPLAAARAVIFAQMVNDPGYQREIGFGVNKKEAEIKREKLFDIIRELVKWENTNNEEVLNRAREAIWESWRETCHLNRSHPNAAELFNPEELPAFHDPFAGGGAIPLEAQRLGLESYASDLNPVAVMINKAMIEIPPKFAGQKPVGPLVPGEKQSELVEDWSGARGLAEDVRRYGHWMREEAFKRIGHLYPKILITEEMAKGRDDLSHLVGDSFTVVAWIWARTVESPSPAYSGIHVPLASTFLLSTAKSGKIYIEPKVNGDLYSFKVKFGNPDSSVSKGTKIGRGANFSCILSGSTISDKYIKSESKAGRMKSVLTAIVLNGPKGRLYVSPDETGQGIIKEDEHYFRPDMQISGTSQYLGVKPYGIDTFERIYTVRQLRMLSEFTSLVEVAQSRVYEDALSTGVDNNAVSLEDGGRGALAYSQAVATYLAFAVDKMSDRHSMLGRWDATATASGIINTFSRQALSMTWDFAEGNPFSGASGSFDGGLSLIKKVLEKSLVTESQGYASQIDAVKQDVSVNKVVSTDPPYYDNVPYADLSDYFYVWLRRSIKGFFPKLFGTIAVPKNEELVAFAYRHEGRDGAFTYFMDGMTKAMARLATDAHPAFPTTIYYAFKQADTKDSGTSSTGWETFLQAVVDAGFIISGTWPMRTELANRIRGIGANALASSIVLVCEKRSIQAESISRRQFQKELRQIMPEALDAMIGGSEGTLPIAPVDLAQASIGPGMAIFSKYESVLNQDGSKMDVHDALILINRAITEYLNPDSGNFDADTLFCDDWFNQFGWSKGKFGEANVLAQAKGTSVDGVYKAGVIESGGGNVRLLKWSEYPKDWNPQTDNRMPIWEACHHMIRELNQNGESGAGALLARMPDRGEQIRQLAYHLYTLCERKNWAEDARAYNELMGSWHAIVAASHEAGHREEQIGLEL